MQDGAFGLSTGLFYVPGTFTPTEEVIELAEGGGAVRRHPHLAHARRGVAASLDSVQETIAIGEQGGLPTQVTHHKIIGQAELGQERRDAAARRRGARPRRRRDDRSVPVHGVEHEHRSGAAAGVGARRRAQADAGAPRRTRRRARKSRPKRIATDPRTSGAAAIRRTCSSRAAASTRRSPGKNLADITRAAAHGADDRERGRDDAVDRRAGRLSGHLPRDERRGPRAHPPPSRRR